MCLLCGLDRPVQCTWCVLEHRPTLVAVGEVPPFGCQWGKAVGYHDVGEQPSRIAGEDAFLVVGIF